MIKSIIFFFIDIWMFLKSFWYRFFSSDNDYQIYNVDVKYTLESEEKPVYNSLFWLREAENWDGKEGQRLTVSTTDINDISPVPSSIKDSVMFITYKYNHQIYVYVTKDMSVTTIPHISKEMSFKIPIEKVVANDDIDLTNEYLSYAGPKLDFHNEDIEIKWLFDYEKISIIDAVNQEIDIDPQTDFVKNLP